MRHLSVTDVCSAALRALDALTRVVNAAQKFAEAYPNTIFLKFFGNSNEKTKKMIRDLASPTTPHFTLWRDGACNNYSPSSSAGLRANTPY